MDVRYLKSLIEVVDRGSIADAARSEHLTSAAIGQRIQVLERELGTALLSRSGHTASPTQACIALLPRARRLVREATLLKSDVSLDGLSGPLRIGAISTALTGILPAALRHLTRAAPNCRPVIVPGTSHDLFEMLQAGELDAFIGANPPFALPKSLRTVTLRREPLMLLTPLGMRGKPDALLRQLPYIRYDPHAWGGRHATNWLADQEIEPTVLCDLDALEAIAILVADGMGVGLVPRWSGIERFAKECRMTQVGDTTYERSILLIRNATPDLPKMIALLEQSLAQGT